MALQAGQYRVTIRLAGRAFRVAARLALLLGARAVAGQEALVLHLYVADFTGQPVEGVQLTPRGRRTTSDPTTADGKTRLSLPATIGVGMTVELALASPATRAWALLNPKVVVPAEEEPEPVELKLMPRKAFQAFLTGGLGELNRIQALERVISPEVRQRVLERYAKEQGFSLDQLTTALRSFQETAEDPFEKGLAALFQGAFREAQVSLGQSYQHRRAQWEKEGREERAAADKLAEAARYLGESEIALGRYASAVTTFREGLVVKPDDGALLNGLGEALRRDGRFAESRGTLELLLASRLEVLGPDHPETLRTMASLANTLMDLGDSARARDLQEQVLEARLRLLGPESLETLHVLSNLARSLEDQGDRVSAGRIQERVLETAQRLFGLNHPFTVTAINNLAANLRGLGELTRPQALHEEALSLARRFFGPDHPETLITMGNLAEAYRLDGNLAAARKLNQEVLEARCGLLGSDHPATLVAMGNLAATLREQGDLDHARALEEEVLAAFLRLLGPDHSITLRAMAHLARTLKAAGDLSSAWELETQVLEDSRRVLVPEHPDTLGAMANMAETLRAQGDSARAFELQGLVLEARRRLFGPEHPGTLRAMESLAETQRTRRDLRAARELQEPALQIRLRKFRPYHPDTLKAMASLATTLRQLEEWAKAQDLYMQLLEASLADSHPDDRETLTLELHLAECLYGQARLDEATLRLDNAVGKLAPLLSNSQGRGLSEIVGSLVESWRAEGRTEWAALVEARVRAVQGGATAPEGSLKSWPRSCPFHGAPPCP